MYLIKISTDLELTAHEFPEGNYAEQNKALRKLIGNECDLYEHVTPKRLYIELMHSNSPTNVPGEAVSMLVDEEGLLKEGVVVNPVASYLYESDKHGHPIVGNVLFVGEEWTDDGINICGIDENVFDKLYKQLENLVHCMKQKGGKS